MKTTWITDRQSLVCQRISIFVRLNWTEWTHGTSDTLYEKSTATMKPKFKRKTLWTEQYARIKAQKNEWRLAGWLTDWHTNQMSGESGCSSARFYLFGVSAFAWLCFACALQLLSPLNPLLLIFANIVNVCQPHLYNPFPFVRVPQLTDMYRYRG